MSDAAEHTVGNDQRGLEVMARLWGQEVANDMLTFWRSVHPDVERHITALALGEVQARPTLDLKTRSLICLASGSGVGGGGTKFGCTRAARCRTARLRRRWSRRSFS